MATKRNPGRKTRRSVKPKTKPKTKKAASKKKVGAAASKKKLQSAKGPLTVRAFQAELKTMQGSLKYLLGSLDRVSDTKPLDISPPADGPIPRCPQVVTDDECIPNVIPPGLMGSECGRGTIPPRLMGDACHPSTTRPLLMAGECVSPLGEGPRPGCPQFVVGDECGPDPVYWPKGTKPFTAVVLKRTLERAGVAINILRWLLRDADPGMKIGG